MDNRGELAYYFLSFSWAKVTVGRNIAAVNRRYQLYIFLLSIPEVFCQLTRDSHGVHSWTGL
jgi:hypothetical protein